jgi:hypothetical protein
LDNKFGVPKFKIIRNGIHFQFGKYYGELGETSAKVSSSNNVSPRASTVKRLKTFLEQIVFKVQILPQKYKII